MLGRYEGEEFPLEIAERPGAKFIKCSQNIYTQLRLHKPRHIKMDDKLTAIRTAIDELIKVYDDSEASRKVFKIPATMRDDYVFAYRRYMLIKKSPDSFYKKDEEKRQELVKEKIQLEANIRKCEIEFAREEDKRRHEVNHQRIQLTAELEGLRLEKKNLEALGSGGKAKCIPGCLKKEVKDIHELTDRIKSIEDRIRALAVSVSPELEDRRYQLTLMHRRRWDVEKILNTSNDSPRERINRWQNAIDNAEIVMIVRKMDIDAAAARYYASCSRVDMNAFVKVYRLISECIDHVGVSADFLKDDVAQLSAFASELYSSEKENNSVQTIYKRLKNHTDINRSQFFDRKLVMASIEAGRTLNIKK